MRSTFRITDNQLPPHMVGWRQMPGRDGLKNESEAMDMDIVDIVSDNTGRDIWTLMKPIIWKKGKIIPTGQRYGKTVREDGVSG